MQLFSKEHFQLVVLQKLKDWEMEKSYMRKHTCLLDNHQRSHYDTITIGPEGMMNWVLQLNNSQSVNLFDSLVEKFNTKRSPNQPNQSPNQFVIDQGNLMSETAQVHTQWKNNMLLKNIMKLRHSTRTTSSTVQSTRRTSTSTFQDYHILQWNNCMAPAFEIWFRKSRTTLIGMHFKVIFNNVNNSILSAKNHKTWLKQLETSNCVNYSMWNPTHSAKYACRTGTSALSTARAGTSCGMDQMRTRSSSSTLLISFRFPATT